MVSLRPQWRGDEFIFYSPNSEHLFLKQIGQHGVRLKKPGKRGEGTRIDGGTEIIENKVDRK